MSTISTTECPDAGLFSAQRVSRAIRGRLAWSQTPKAPPPCRDSAANKLEQRKRGAPAPLKIGLTGFNARTGLGYQNRDLVKRLDFEKWLCLQHPYLESLPGVQGVSSETIALEADDGVIDKWLEGLDCVLFYEQPLLESLPARATAKGIAVACIPNWEWLSPLAHWLKHVDLFICPNRFTYELLQRWKMLSGYPWELAYVPAPLDTERFPFQQRERCERFLFVNGNGGCTPFFKGLIGDKRGPRRKGFETVVAAAKLVPEIPIAMRSQLKQLPLALPPNVELLPEAEDNTRLFEIGDVAIQPSLFEGTGLQLLETLSSGMPLIATDAPPMNEMPNLRRIPATTRRGKVVDNIIDVSLPSADALAQAMRETYQTDISEASREARAYIEREHSWSEATQAMQRLLGWTRE